MAKKPTPSATPLQRGTTHQGPRARRELSKKQLEEQQQSRLVLITSIAIAAVVVVLIGGLMYDQLWLPSRTLAQVNSASLTRQDYWEEERITLASQVVQNLQMLMMFGDQEFAQQFAGQSMTINFQAQNIRAQPENQQTIRQWQEQQIVQQGAATFSINVTPQEIDQALVSDLQDIFLPPTADLTPTATLTTAATITQPNMPLPSPTIRPTPQLEESSEQARAIADYVYNFYIGELDLARMQPELTPDDFLIALQQRYRSSLIRQKIEEHLVPTDTFTTTDHPDSVRASQIFLAVNLPEDATDQEREAAFQERKVEAEALLRQVRDADDIAALASLHSDDLGSRDQAGDIGLFNEEGRLESGMMLSPELVEAAFERDEGEVGDLIRTPFGWHILVVTERRVPDETQQLRVARSEAFQTWIEEQRTQATIQSDAIETPTPTTEPMPTPVPTYLPGPPTPFPTPIAPPDGEFMPSDDAITIP